MDKQIAGYIFLKLKEWYIEAGGDWDKNDFSRLKFRKLSFCLFATSRELFNLLDNDKVQIQPYGHFISAFEPFTISEIQELNPKFKVSEIDKAIIKLKELNYNLILFMPFDLVDLNQTFQSFKTIYSIIKKNNKCWFESEHKTLIYENEYLLLKSSLK